MPFIEDKELEIQFQRAIGDDPIAPAEYSFAERFKAAYRLENTVGSFTAQENFLPDGKKVTDYDPWDELTDEERLDEAFIENIVYVDNRQELTAVRNQYQRENRDREILADGGILPTLAAAVIDPINLIPVGGTAFRTYKKGGSILQNAMAVASAATISTAATEAELHRTQITRTFGESAANMTGAALLGGVLGAAPAAIMRMLTKQDLDIIEKTLDPESKVANGQNPTVHHAGAAEVDYDPKVKGSFAEKLLKAMPFDPLSRTITSEASTTRRAVSELAEIPIEMDTTIRTSVESAIKVHDGKLFEALDGYIKIHDEYKANGGKLKRREFAEAVGKAMRNGSDDPYIQRAADQWRTKLYDPLKQEAINAKLLPEDVDVATAEEYLNRVWSKEKITQNFPAFVKTVSKWLDDQYEAKISGQADVERLDSVVKETKLKQSKLIKSKTTVEKKLKTAKKQLEEVRRAEKASIERAFKTKEQKPTVRKKGQRAELGIAESRQRTRSNDLQDRISGYQNKINDIDERIAKLEETNLKALSEIEDTFSALPSKIANDVKRAIKARDGDAIKKSYKALEAAIRKIKTADYDAVDTESLAREIAGRIMGTPDGRLPYDYKIGENSGGVSNNLSSPFQKRAFVIPDKLVEDFLENDIELLGSRYLKNVAPDVELTKRFGDVEMKTQMKEIQDEYQIKMEKAPEKERAKIEKRMSKDIRDLAAMRDRIRGVYNIPDSNNIWVRSGRVARDLNYMRLLGGVVAASIPDVGRILGAEGIAKTFSKGLKPLVTNLKGFKVAAAEAKRYGVGVDVLMGGRAEIIADTVDYAAGGTAFERAVRSAATKFSSINLMNYWTGGMKQLHAVVMQNTVIDDLVKGGYDKRLAQLGIDEADAKNIAAQMKKYAKQIDDVWVANTKDWDNQDLALMWKAAVRKESDRVVIVPGQEKPLFMSSELGKTVGQFKTFMMSATQRIMISSLQGQDKHFIQGVVGMVSLGMLSYAFKQWDSGREISDDPMAWVAEGIDRSGVLGVLMEANNTMEKVSGNTLGLRPLFGIAAPASRYASRSALDSAVGPTFGLLGDILNVMGVVSGNRDWSEADVRAFRRLLPLQNLSIIRQGFDLLEEAAI